jgi:multiple sugar transport system permease protein
MAGLLTVAKAGYTFARSQNWRQRRLRATPYLFIAPNMILFTVFIFGPLLYAAYISLHEWSVIGESRFIGAANYQRMIKDGLFWQSLRNTAIYALCTVPSSLALGLLLALGLNRDLYGRTVLRSLYFLPVVVSSVVTALTAAPYRGCPRPRSPCHPSC